MTAMNDPIFHDDDAARRHLEAIRWPHGPVCPHCGNVDQDTIAKVEGTKRSHRPGLYYCNACKGQFTVTVGTVMERSKVPLHKWVFAFHQYAASKKGLSAHQLHRMLGVTYKTAWFMAHRIREAMRSDDTTPMGGDGGAVEIDETFISKDPKFTRYAKSNVGLRQKMKVLALVDRSTGKARTTVIEHLSARDIAPILDANISREARVFTDEASYHRRLGERFADHQSVNHSAGEYGRGEAHTNTLENYFSIFKRGMRGVYQHCGKQHLHRYAAEYQFRYNHRAALDIDDAERAAAIAKGTEGKRLTYRRPDTRASA